MKTIFPAAIIEQSTECYQSKIAVRSKVLYLSAIGFLILTFISLPFIYVDLSVQARGTLQSSLQRNEVFVPVSGRVHRIYLSENEKVKKGDVIAEVETEQLDLELDGHRQRAALLQGFLADLDKLRKSSLAKAELTQFSSEVYRSSYYEFYAAYENLRSALEKATRDFERSQFLYESKAISFAEFDETKLKFEQSQTAL